jgi:hypothetical protein
MPETEEAKKKEPMVDIDTSGPEVDVDISEEKKAEATEQVQEEKIEVVEEKQETGDKEQETKKEETKAKEEEKPELEEYSEGVQKRIAKLTKKWREAERQREAALEYAKTVQQEHTQLKTRFSKMEPNYVQALENRILSGMEAAKAKLATAREAGDINAEVDAQKDIARLGIDEARVNAMKERQSQDKEKVVRTPTPEQAMGQQAPRPDPKAEAWAEKNPWFGQDNAMTYTAFDLHKKLTEQEGFDPNSDEYYAEVDKRMRLDFPHKFGTNEKTVTTKPAQTVASATRSARTGRKTMRLTSSQVAIAKKLGVPLEEYAKQLKLTKEV